MVGSVTQFTKLNHNPILRMGFCDVTERWKREGIHHKKEEREERLEHIAPLERERSWN